MSTTLALSADVLAEVLDRLEEYVQSLRAL